MRKLLSTLSLLTCLALSGVSYADTTFRGQTISLGGMEFSGPAHMYGNFQARSNLFDDSLDVFGEAHFLDSTVYGVLNVQGPLEAINSEFRSQVIVDGQHVRFVGTHAGSLTVHSASGKPVVELTSGSIIDGDVRFEGQAGELIKTGGSTIGGRVINAEGDDTSKPERDSNKIDHHKPTQHKLFFRMR